MIRRIRKTLAALLMALAFIINVACSHLPKPQPILVPCKVPPITRPVFPFDSLQPGTDVFTQMKTLLADRKVRIGYETKLEAGVESCR